MEQVKLCKRGHERTPENVSNNGSCKKCMELCLAAYRQTPKGAAARAAYGSALRQNPKHRAYMKEYMARYGQTAEKMSYNAEYRSSLADGYIASQIGIPLMQIPPELIALKRKQIEHIRHARTLQKSLEV